MLGKIIKWVLFKTLLLVAVIFSYGCTEAKIDHSRGELPVTLVSETIAPVIDHSRNEKTKILLKFVSPNSNASIKEPHYWDGLNKQEQAFLIKIHGSEPKARLILLITIVQAKTITLQDTTYELQEMEHWKKEYLKNPPEKEPIDTEMDEKLRGQIISKLGSAPYLFGYEINVSVLDRVVTLTGTIPSGRQELVVEIADSIHGVKEVVNQMELTSQKSTPLSH